jgi:hypothetical protein
MQDKMSAKINNNVTFSQFVRFENEYDLE